MVYHVSEGNEIPPLNGSMTRDNFVTDFHNHSPHLFLRGTMETAELSTLIKLAVDHPFVCFVFCDHHGKRWYNVMIQKTVSRMVLFQRPGKDTWENMDVVIVGTIEDGTEMTGVLLFGKRA